MLILLPPSETKRDGGVHGPLDFGQLAYPRLSAKRRALTRAVRTLARDSEASVRALKLGRTQLGEVARNRTIATAPTMPAIDRYTGVLYDALDAESLSDAARIRAAEVVRIHSSLFGPVGALDPVPAYRLSFDSRLPDLPLKAHWAKAVSRELGETTGLLLDLRSEGYVALGPAPRRDGSFFLRVLTRAEDGEVRALNHFNKQAKGRFTRSLLTAETLPANESELLLWAAAAGWDLRLGAPGELQLIL